MRALVSLLHHRPLAAAAAALLLPRSPASIASSLLLVLCGCDVSGFFHRSFASPAIVILSRRRVVHSFVLYSALTTSLTTSSHSLRREVPPSLPVASTTTSRGDIFHARLVAGRLCFAQPLLSLYAEGSARFQLPTAPECFTTATPLASPSHCSGLHTT